MFESWETRRGHVPIETQGHVWTERDGQDPRSKIVVSIEEPRAQEGNIEELCGSATSPGPAKPGSSVGERQPPLVTENVQHNSGSTQSEETSIVIASIENLIEQDQVWIS